MKYYILFGPPGAGKGTHASAIAKKYNLKHIDTGQILVEAMKRGLITEADGNSIWSKMLAKKRKLPGNTFSEYLANQQNDI